MGKSTDSQRLRLFVFTLAVGWHGASRPSSPPATQLRTDLFVLRGRLPSADTAVIGAYANDDGGTDSGSAYVFARSGVAWSEQAKLTAASDSAAGDQFGISVAVRRRHGHDGQIRMTMVALPAVRPTSLPAVGGRGTSKPSSPPATPPPPPPPTPTPHYTWPRNHHGHFLG